MSMTNHLDERCKMIPTMLKTIFVLLWDLNYKGCLAALVFSSNYTVQQNIEYQTPPFYFPGQREETIYCKGISSFKEEDASGW